MGGGPHYRTTSATSLCLVGAPWVMDADGPLMCDIASRQNRALLSRNMAILCRNKGDPENQ